MGRTKKDCSSGSEAGKLVSQSILDKLSRALGVIEENGKKRVKQTILRHDNVDRDIAVKATNHDFAELHTSSDHSATISVGKQSVLEGSGFGSVVATIGNESAVYNLWYDRGSSALICAGEDSAARCASVHSLSAATAKRSAAEAIEDYSAAVTVEEDSLARASGYHTLAACTSAHSLAAQDGTLGGVAVATDTESIADVGKDCRFGSAVATFTRSCSKADCQEGIAVATGVESQAKIGKNGLSSVAIVTSNYSCASAEGHNNIAIATGRNSRAKGTLGNWIICTEREPSGKIVCIKSAVVDGVDIKPDTYYALKNGVFVEI